MKNLKTYLHANSVLLLVVMIIGVMVCSSCSKKDDEPQLTDKPTSNNELVGTWYFTYNGETDYDDYFIFTSNNTGTYHYDDEQSDDFTYTYDPKSKILCLNYNHWESERFPIVWLGNNAAEFGDYGKYVRR